MGVNEHVVDSWGGEDEQSASNYRCVHGIVEKCPAEIGVI